jgi:hypothetical protein
LTEFTQLYLTPKIFLMGSSLAFSLKEDPVRCAKVCDKSWVILTHLHLFIYRLVREIFGINIEFGIELLIPTFNLKFVFSKKATKIDLTLTT